MAMKYFFGSLLILCAGFFSFGQTVTHQYTPSDAGSSVTFSIKNFGLNSKGSFTGLLGNIVFDGRNPGGCSFDVTINAASINTDNEVRDEHLKKEGYFDVVKYPRIRLVSSSVGAADKDGHYAFTGNLTIKDKTKEISFPFLATPVGDDYIFKGSFTINRRDFGVGGSSTLANNLTVTVTVLAKRQ
jgi:polyisoprenoid-binding protein YceI